MGTHWTTQLHTVSLVVVPRLILIYQEQIDYLDAKLIWAHWEQHYPDYLNYEFKKNRITLTQGNDQIMLRFPPLFTGEKPDQIKSEPGHYLVMLIEAGQGSCGYFENGEMIAHRVFRGYMVRKKQGKAQITYLKRKGKSRAGSRMRLNATTLFIQEMIHWVNDHVDSKDLNRVILGVSPQFWPLFYQQDEQFCFDQRDTRIIPPGLHWIKAGYKEMLYIAQNCYRGTLLDLSSETGDTIVQYCTLNQGGDDG